MNRRQFLAATAIGGLALSAPSAFGARARIRTAWIARGSEGFDALSFLGPLSGDPFYANHYPVELAAFAPRLGNSALADIRALKESLSAGGRLIGPFLDLVFSSGHDSTLATLRAALDSADTALMPAYRSSVYWSVESWAAFTAAAPTLRRILAAMEAAGFSEYWSSLVTPLLERRLAGLRPRLAAFDVIPELERYTGRRFDPRIEVVLLHFCKPHGIKVQGQQFLSAIGWNDDIVIRTAGHELLHPPVDLEGPAARAALAVLARDPLLARIVDEHDPAFGYRTLQGLFDEDLASAIDQIVAERLGTARDPRERWNSVDDGMHVLAAGFYGLMRRSGHARDGGDLEDWLAGAVEEGWLEPAVLHDAAAGILGRPASSLWPLPPDLRG